MNGRTDQTGRTTSEWYQMFVVKLGNNDDSQHPTPDTAYGDGAYAWQTFNASCIAQRKDIEDRNAPSWGVFHGRAAGLAARGR